MLISTERDQLGDENCFASDIMPACCKILSKFTKQMSDELILALTVN